MRPRLVAVLAVSGLMLLGACSDDPPDTDAPDSAPGPSGGSAQPLTQEQTAELLLSAEDFPLEGFERSEPAGVSTELAVLDASALLDSEDLSEECREAAALARATPPPEAGTQASYTSVAGTDGVGREVTVVVFSTPVALDYLGGYTEQAEACGTVEEGGRTLELSTLTTEGVGGYRLVTEVQGSSIDLLLAGRSVGANHVVVTGVSLTEEDAVQVLEAQVAALPSGS